MKAIALVLLSLVVACSTGDRKPRKTASVVVAAQDLPAGRELAVLDLSRITLPAECATPAIIDADKIQGLVGQSLVHAIPKGEPLRVQDVVQDLTCHHGPMMPVVAVTKDLKRGERLSEENVSMRVIPEEQATASVVRMQGNPADPDFAKKMDAWKKVVLGKKLTVKQLHAGDVLRLSDIEGG